MGEITHNERMANVGESVELKSLGSLTVRELSLEDTMRVGKELMEVASTLDFGGNSKGAGGGFAVFADALGNPDVARAFRVIAACSTGKKAADFEGMGIIDWLRLVNVMKRVHNFEELRELFTNLIPGADGLMSRLTERAVTSPTPSGSLRATGSGRAKPSG